MSKPSDKIIIAGPCALESRQQLKENVHILKQVGVNIIRACLWKPRTRPGWEGLGEDFLPILLEETLIHGLVPATEIICAEHAQSVVKALENVEGDASILVWLGSRNQNHLEQRAIAKILASGPPGIHFMFKNQMWEDELHWFGIYEHILSAGFPRSRLLSCHRGFAPGKSPNPRGYRNLPDFEMAMWIKEKTGIPMLLDPSHIGGTSENVIEICARAKAYDFDGYLVETQCEPEKAKTDAQQQLSPNQFQELLKLIRGHSEAIAKVQI